MNHVKGLLAIALLLGTLGLGGTTAAAVAGGDFDPPDRGAPTETGGAGSRLTQVMVLKLLAEYQPPNNGAPDNSDGSGSRFRYNILMHTLGVA